MSAKSHHPRVSEARDVKDVVLMRPAFGASRRALLCGASAIVVGTMLIAPNSAMARALNGGGSGGAVAAPNIASEAAAQAAQQAAAAAQQSQQSLARAARAVQDMQGIQNAARAAAAAAQVSVTAPMVVPNGLGAGGLLPNMPAGWTGANAPTQGSDGKGQTEVNIRQTTQQAILNWQSFNVGARTTLTFDQQGKANWVALNRIDKASGPSQILGNIKADGHVYVINQSGIIFGGNSQVNVGSLIASTADLSPENFTKNGIYSADGLVANFTAAARKVVVEAGASISTRAPSSVTSGGGFVLMIGSQVENAGSIATPKGQTLLAAGDDFILRRGFGTGGNVSSTTRGIEISTTIGATSTNGGVANRGLILAQQGDITLAGRTLAQSGVVLSTSSVNNRGTIHLANSAADRKGSVTLAAGSVTAILPELDSSETALDSQRDALIKSSDAANLARIASATGAFDNMSLLADRQDQSRIEIVTGGVVNFQNQSQTMAQGGQIAVSAGTRVFAENGASIDVSGTRNVLLPMSANQVQVNVQGNELRDSPVNRDSGALINKNIWIDIRDLVLVAAKTGIYASDRYYTKGGLLELGGYLSNTAHKIGEWTAVGGTITLGAPEVVAQQGARFDISGGSVSYEGGRIYSTKVIGSDGRIYSFDNAPADMKFVGVAGGFARTHNIQGRVADQLTEVWSTVFDRSTSWRYEAGYTVGRDAGRLNLATPTAVFEAELIADIVKGERQNSARANVADGYKQVQNAAPLAGTLGLGQYTSTGRTGFDKTDIRIGDIADITAGMGAHSVLPTGRTNTARFDASRLSAYGLGRLELGSERTITITSDLTLADGGALDLTAAFIDIDAAITARGGSVIASNAFKTSAGNIIYMTEDDRSAVTLHDQARLDLRGAWSNAPTGGRQDLAHLDGGAVSLQSSRDVILQRGSQIDVSSGASISVAGKMTGGRGGNVTLTASLNTNNVSGQLLIDGNIRAYGVNGGGTLSVNSERAIVIGGAGTDAARLHLGTDLFRTGFSQYNIMGGRGLTVAQDAQLDVSMPVLRLTANGLDAGSAIDDALQVWTQPLYTENPRTSVLTQRKGAGVSLSAGHIATTATDLPNIGVSVEKGAVVRVDPGQTVSLLSIGRISVDGTIEAWNGSVEMGPNVRSLLVDVAKGHNRAIRIGATGVVDVAARAVTARDVRGRAYGIVKAGGDIRIGGKFDPAAGENDVGDLFVVIERGAKLDASGTQADLYVAGRGTTSVTTDGGSILLASRSGLYLNGDLKAHAGGTGAAGGRLSVALEDNAYENVSVSNRVKSGGKEFVLTQTHVGGSIPAGDLTYGHAVLGVNQITQGGFGRVALLSDDLFSFDSALDLNVAQSVELYAPNFRLAETAQADTRINIAAPYVRLAGALRFVKDHHSNAAFTAATSRPASTARLAVAGQLIDVRDIVNFGTATGTVIRRGFTDLDLTSAGDIRLVAGVVGIDTRLSGPKNLNLTAAQIYPTTQARVTITVDHLTTARSGTTDPVVPYSAFGRLQIDADTIQHAGVMRAPLGEIVLGTTNGVEMGPFRRRGSAAIDLLAGSILSVSGQGLLMPYGGTVDGVTFNYADQSLANTLLGTAPTPGNLSLRGQSITAAEGAVIDLRGGGTLTGAGFISGRGGSVNILTAPLVAANPGFGFSAAGNKVYAIVPGSALNYAAAASPGSAGDPVIGQTVTLDGSVPGLPAGTYTLLQSNYALLPGAVRVEIGASTGRGGALQAMALDGGSYVTSGRLGIANTAIQESLSRQVIVTPGKTVRGHSLYNETGYAQFAIADAARLGVPRTRLPMDARSLTLELADNLGNRPSLAIRGDVRSTADAGGWGSRVFVLPSNSIEIRAAGRAPTAGFTGVSLIDTDLNALNAGQLMIGGSSSSIYGQGGNFVTFRSSTTNVVVRSGAVLHASDIFLISGAVAGGITVEQGARLDTLGRGSAGADSRDGFVYAPGTLSILAVANSHLTMLAAEAGASNSQWGPGRIEVGTCGTICAGTTQLYSEGTIVAATNNLFRLEDSVRYGTRNLTLAVGGVNIGTDATLAAAAAAGTLPPGLAMSQAVLDRLLQGDTTTGAPALETLVLNSREAFNLFGTVTLDTIDPATGKSRLKELVLTSPGLYGAGSAGDVATIRTGTLIWNGSTAPATPVLTGGAGTGTGTLSVEAERIEFGYGPKAIADNAADNARLALGFSTVNLSASARVTANNKGSLAVYQSQGAYVAGTGYAYQGGNLNITTPLLTGAAGSVNRITAGGTIHVASPAGAATIPSTDALGAELALNGNHLVIDGRIVLPSGKLSLTAVHDLTLTNAARLDVAGRAVTFSDVKKHSWGGDITLESRDGNIHQAAGSVIDLSAAHNNAGSLTATALNAATGMVDLQGTILGSSSGHYDASGTIVSYRGGSVSLRAQRLGGAGALSDQFAALNGRLNAGAVFGARSFQFKQGDLVIGSEMKAGEINVSLDGGQLTVIGTIDASGDSVGTIRLAAKNGLTLAGSAVLDAHGTVLRVDSYGRIIDSPNRAVVQLNSGNGRLALALGARIDLRHGTNAAIGSGAGQNDGRARGTLELNAPRIGSNGLVTDTDAITHGDIDIDVSGLPNIQGARLIAVNAMRSYDNAPEAAAPAANGRPYQYIDQAWLDARHTESESFINAARGRATLVSGKLAGLNNATYRDAFHLRPGVEVVSKTPDGDIVVQGDLDLSGHRYQSLNPHTQRVGGLAGSGEVGVLTLRAGGDLNIYGSINDGFAKPPETPDDVGWVLTPGKQMFNGDVVIPRTGIALQDGTLFPAGVTLNYDLPISAMTVAAGTRLPVAAKIAGDTVLPQNTLLAAAIRNQDGSIAYAAGTRLAQAVTLTNGMTLDAGTLLAGDTALQAMMWPKGVALPHLPASAVANRIPDVVRQNGIVNLGIGAIIPAATDVKLEAGVTQINLREGNGKGTNWAVAAMLPEGSQSWTMRLVAGADTQAADNRLTNPYAAHGTLRLADTHYGMIGKSEIPQLINFAGAEFDGDMSLIGQPISVLAERMGMSAQELCDAGFCTEDPNATPSFSYALGRTTFSVLRTGTGDLDLVSSRDLTMQSLYGVYTAGTSSLPHADGRASGFDLARGTAMDPNSGLSTGLVLGKSGAEFEKLVNGSSDSLYRAWYPDGGGNLLLSVGGNLTGDTFGKKSSQGAGEDPIETGSSGVGNWLWRQGSGSVTIDQAIPTAWWINFGSYIFDSGTRTAGFTGFGTLGGGNVDIRVGGDAGMLAPRGDTSVGTATRSQALVVAVGSTGRVIDGKLQQTGGGDLDIRIGGGLNPSSQARLFGNQRHDLNGALVDLRGTMRLDAGMLGGIPLTFGRYAVDQDPKETRAYDPFRSSLAKAAGGLILVPGDATMHVATRGDLVLAGAADAGRVPSYNPSAFTVNGVQPDGMSRSWFSLWTDRTAIDLFTAGGNLTPTTLSSDTQFAFTGLRMGFDHSPTDGRSVYPSILRAVAANGSIYYGPTLTGGTGMANDPGNSMVLAPGRNGELTFLASNSIFAGGYTINVSGADASILATPFAPGFVYGNPNRYVTNAGSAMQLPLSNPLFAFGGDTASGTNAGADAPIRFYARDGDIVGLRSGQIIIPESQAQGWPFREVPAAWYAAARPVWIKAGRDIVNSGSRGAGTVTNLIVHNRETDVSMVSAGRDLIYSSFMIAGPGTLEISAGRNIQMDDRASIVSMGPVVPGDTRPGAGISMLAGAGSAGPDYQALLRYLDPANVVAAGTPLEGSGKVAKTYERELAAWLKQRYQFEGGLDETRAYFDGLPSEQQRVFLREVYYAELTAGGREYNDSRSPRFGSYLRGRAMIASLFPQADAAGNAIGYQGDIIMFGDSGLRTDFGGAIQVMAPGGRFAIGVDGVTPPATAGLITQGVGDIQIYSQGSVLLGLSRIMTTFGGNIIGWSASGDINAGRGAKTTVLYTPPKRVYDNYGHVTLSPNVPSSGAGIATLNPIPEVPAGDIDLIAPLGTIDAGEAGIRVSGNINLAALQIVNAANISVQGSSSGIPTVQAPSISASLSSSNATAATQQSAAPTQSANTQPSVIIVEVLGYGGGSGGSEPALDDEKKRREPRRETYDRNSPLQLVGAGPLTDRQQQALTVEERRELERN